MGIGPTIDPADVGTTGLLWLFLTYGYAPYYAADLIGEGSELLLLVPSMAGLVGGVVLPMLGAVPDGGTYHPNSTVEYGTTAVPQLYHSCIDPPIRKRFSHENSSYLLLFMHSHYTLLWSWVHRGGSRESKRRDRGVGRIYNHAFDCPMGTLCLCWTRRHRLWKTAVLGKTKSSSKSVVFRYSKQYRGISIK